ncbi:PAS domain-containing protein [Bradyrhizobium frederickii]|uniref:PAS domain-containing protein n=1 Tax=Bradyrhizobium frederickii TaxID=2560054 RepID=UPI003221A14E
MLAANRRELALLQAEEVGAQTYPLGQPSRKADDPSDLREQHLSDFSDSPHPYMLLDPGPGLRIVDINMAYAKATLTDPGRVVGRSLFEVFPDNPDDPLADGVSNLFAPLQRVAQTGRAHAMAVQRYDIQKPDGSFAERHWQPINSPIYDQDERLAFLLHHVEDVTDQVASCARINGASPARPPRAAPVALLTKWRDMQAGHDTET